MSKNDVVKNYIFNMIYQVTSILIPIVTIPYVSRVLGVDSIGINGYTYSIAVFFAGICFFGIGNYGSRSIACVRDDKSKLTDTFWEIWILQLITSTISIIIYLIVFVFFNIADMRLIFVMQLPILLAALTDISWFFMGIEDFKKTVIRNIAVKLIGLIFIFIFIKKPEDVWLYALINSMISFIGNITFWFFIPKYVGRPYIHTKNIINHLKGAVIFLIPQLATQIYTTLDKVVIGGLSSVTEVGFYDQSQKITRISLTFVTSLSMVLMPRIANLFSNNNYKQIKLYIKKSLNFTFSFSCLIASSICVISKEFVPIFFGDDFIGIVSLMMLSSFMIIFISIGGVFANQFALPLGKMKEYNIPLIIASIINIVSNILLVPSLGALGGVISIVVTELAVALLRIYLMKEFLNLKFIFKGTWVYLLAGITSFTISYQVIEILFDGILAIFIGGTINVIIFVSVILLINNPIRNEFFNFIKKYNKNV